MSEIKTCEEYVVVKLQECEDKIFIRDGYIKELEQKIRSMHEQQAHIMKLLEFKLNSSAYKSMNYISISASVWQDDDGYNWLKKLLEDKYDYDFTGKDEEATE